MKAAVAALSELREMNGQKFITAKDAPLRPILWRVLVQPLPPKTQTDGGLALAEISVDAEESLTCIGKIVDHGEFFFASKTNAGLELAKDPRKPSIGDFVLFAQYAGQGVELRNAEKTKLRLLDDTEILAVVSDPELIKRYT